MEKIKKNLREIRIKRLINLAKELEHFKSITNYETWDTIELERLIYSVEMKLLKRFSDLSIYSLEKNIISITIYK
jgi:hypothetical protein